MCHWKKENLCLIRLAKQKTGAGSRREICSKARSQRLDRNNDTFDLNCWFAQQQDTRAQFWKLYGSCFVLIWQLLFRGNAFRLVKLQTPVLKRAKCLVFIFLSFSHGTSAVFTKRVHLLFYALAN